MKEGRMASTRPRSFQASHQGTRLTDAFSPSAKNLSLLSRPLPLSHWSASFGLPLSPCCRIYFSPVRSRRCPLIVQRNGWKHRADSHHDLDGNQSAIAASLCVRSRLAHPDAVGGTRISRAAVAMHASFRFCRSHDVAIQYQRCRCSTTVDVLATSSLPTTGHL